MDLQQERQQVHSLIDQLPPAKLGAVRNLLEVMLEEDGELTPELRERLLASRAYFANGGKGVPMEEVLADFGVGMDDFPPAK